MRKIAMRTSDDCLGNKKIDYKYIALASLYSNWDKGNRNILSVKNETLKENKENIEKITNTSVESMIHALTRSMKENSSLIYSTRLRSNKRVINILCKNKQNREYVLIEEDILKMLVENGNSNIIKVYLFLKYYCCKESKTITREYICKKIGLSPCTSNLSRVSSFAKSLEDMGLIERKNTRDGVILHTSYSLRSYEDWKRINGVM